MYEVNLHTRQILSFGMPESPAQAAEVWRDFLGSGVEGRDRALALGWLGECLAMKGDSAGALDCFDDALDIPVGPAEAVTILCGYALFLVRSGRSAGHERVLSGLLAQLTSSPEECAPVAPWGWSYVARLELITGESDRALEHAKRAVGAAQALTPAVGLAEAMSTLSVVQEQRGDLRTAIEALEEAMCAMRERHCLMEARARHGQLSLQLGDAVQALTSFSRAVEFADFRDRRILADVFRSISALCRIDPDRAAELTSSLAARLTSSTM